MCSSYALRYPQPETRSKSSAILPAFQVLDTDCDGRISLNDLRTFYSGYCGAKTATEEDLGSMISVADSNQDGFVEFEEFERVLGGCTGPAGGGSGLMEDVFRVMDIDGDGKLGFHDLKSYMSRAGFSASDADIWDMIRMGGGDEKEGVGFDGLLKILDVDLSRA